MEWLAFVICLLPSALAAYFAFRDWPMRDPDKAREIFLAYVEYRFEMRYREIFWQYVKARMPTNHSQREITAKEEALEWAYKKAVDRFGGKILSLDKVRETIRETEEKLWELSRTSVPEHKADWWPETRRRM